MNASITQMAAARAPVTNTSSNASTMSSASAAPVENAVLISRLTAAR
jgi:hypothetical protein